MGHIVKYIMGNDNISPKYSEWTIECNSDGKVHIHLENIRMDLSIEAYNQFHDLIKQAYDKQKKN